MANPSIPNLFGDLDHNGFEIWERAGQAPAESCALPAATVSLLLNLRGRATATTAAGETVAIGPSSVSLLVRRGGCPLLNLEWHETGSQAFLLIMPLARFRELLTRAASSLSEELRQTVFTDGQESACVTLSEISPRLLRLAGELKTVPVPDAAAHFWYESRLLECIALTGFKAAEHQESEFFCTRQKRLAQQRIAKSKQYLAAHSDEPLCLGALAKHVGCSASYLCRLFSEQTGSTISQHLRSLRIQRAAALLRTGNFNVSEVAVEVGYQSLSHFSKAFREEKGCLPSRYLGKAA